MNKDIAYTSFVDHKARIYFDISRDKFGNPLKTLDQCRTEVIEDFDEEHFKLFTDTLKKYKQHYTDRIGVTWADSSRDVDRDCADCLTLCNNPVHPEFYREKAVATHTAKERKADDNE